MTKDDYNEIAGALMDTLQTDTPATGGPVNLVDMVGDLTTAVHAVANSIYPRGVMPGHDSSGGTVASLTEAVMGVTHGLNRIADAIYRLAEVQEAK